MKYWIYSNNLVSQIWNVFTHQEKYGNGRKITKAKLSTFVDNILKKREKQKPQQTESENLDLKFEKERQYQEEMH